jgi:hypothetical protein
MLSGLVIEPPSPSYGGLFGAPTEALPHAVSRANARRDTVQASEATTAARPNDVATRREASMMMTSLSWTSLVRIGIAELLVIEKERRTADSEGMLYGQLSPAQEEKSDAGSRQ